MPETERLELSKYFFVLIVLISYSELSAQVYPDAVVDSLLRSGIKSVVNQNYKSAQIIFNKLDKEFPSLPLGKIYLAANKIAEEYDYKEKFDESYIRKNLELAINQSEELLDLDQANIWNKYFYSLAEGYISYFEAINSNWLSALTTGVNSITEFEEILKVDENFYEAYIAIGTFEYWKSSKLEFVNWLPFSKDTKDTGIELLVTAIDSSSYNSYLAVNSLIWIYIDQKNFSKAIEIAKKALVQFPDSRTFKWGLARAYEESDPLKSIKLYKEILNSYLELKNGNYINEITLMHIIAQQYAKLDDKENAIKYCNEILSMTNLPEDIFEQMNDRIEKVKKLKEDLTSKN
jgi:tetratricopeptide (TPR) repeat protein